MKTRPTQNAVHQLNSYGVQTNIVIARSALPLDQKRKEKIAISSNVTPDHIISAPDVDSIYDVPLNFEKEKIGEMILKTLKLPKKSGSGMREWGNFVSKMRTAKKRAFHSDCREIFRHR